MGIEMYRREIAERAALLFRLGYSVEQAIARMQANIEWDFELGATRPADLDPPHVAEIVRTTYARRPAL